MRKHSTAQQKIVHSHGAGTLACVGRMWLISRLCCIMLDIVDHSVFRGPILIVWQQQCSDHTLQCYFNLSAAFPACQRQNFWKIGGLTARNMSFFINPGTPLRTHTAVLVVARRAVHLEIRLKPKKWNLSFWFFTTKKGDSGWTTS